ncbi:MAG TPA: hypothetical protein PLV92_13315, partial [Pirellulaceae bacterium]|nr:hypothetical protein [Pirellulaceae bacterium]
MRSYTDDIRLTVDDVDFFGGAGSVRGPQELSLRAASPQWTIRLGTSAETGGGGDVNPADAPRALDVSTRDLAALADGFSTITIGSAGAGDVMRIGDAFAMNQIKATGEARVVDASLKDETLMLAESFVVEGDARAPNNSLTLVGATVDVRRTNLHTPNSATVDAGLTAERLELELADSLHVGGWLRATNSLTVHATAGTSATGIALDSGAAIETTGDGATLLLDTPASMLIGGRVATTGAGVAPVLQAGGELRLLSGADLSAAGADATLEVTAGTFLSFEDGSSVRVGVEVDLSSGVPVYSMTGARGRIVIDSPHELLLGGLVATSGGASFSAGAPLQDHPEVFQELFRQDPTHYLAEQKSYGILLAGTLAVMGAGEEVKLSTPNDLIVLGNIQVSGDDSSLRLHSEKFLFVEGRIAVANSTALYGGVDAYGVSLDGADSRGSSVYVGRTALITTQEAGSQIDLRGARDVDVYGALVAGGAPGSSGIVWSGPGASLRVAAGQQVYLDGVLQAAGDVDVESAGVGQDDGDLGIVASSVSGVGSGGQTVGGLGTHVRLSSPGTIEFAGTALAGATEFTTGGGTSGEQLVWSTEPSSLILSAGGPLVIGGHSVNPAGATVEFGASLAAARSIELRGGVGPDVNVPGVSLFAASRVQTHAADGSITITAAHDAELSGDIASGGRIDDRYDANGQPIGREVVSFGGTSTLSVVADDQVRIGQTLSAGGLIEIRGGSDPLDATVTNSGRSVVLFGSATLQVDGAQGQVSIVGPNGIDILPSSGFTPANPALTDSAPQADAHYAVLVTGVGGAVTLDTRQTADVNDGNGSGNGSGSGSGGAPGNGGNGAPSNTSSAAIYLGGRVFSHGG